MKIRLGIIGAEIAANKLHWPAIQSLPDEFQVVVVCSRTEAHAKAFAQLLGGVRTSSIIGRS